MGGDWLSAEESGKGWAVTDEWLEGRVGEGRGGGQMSLHGKNSAN